MKQVWEVQIVIQLNYLYLLQEDMILRFFGGDGTHYRITQWNQSEVMHSYPHEGEYKIRIKGDIIGFRFSDSGDKNKIIDIKNWGSLRLGGYRGYFQGCSNLDVSATDVLNLTGTTDMGSMFDGATSFNGDISLWNTNRVIDCGNFSRGASAWNSTNQPTFSICTP